MVFGSDVMFVGCQLDRSARTQTADWHALVCHVHSQEMLLVMLCGRQRVGTVNTSHKQNLLAFDFDVIRFSSVVHTSCHKVE